ncbi:hypothetical protein [Hymenobacter yonginensis]|uniref:DUF4274 domain-containing protein n=1 Tax=Hymenobacter yonginensis TaxID=748197 RepID=A0ABY7PU21_9BACT|nr:hypothetical protein [Hymenobacter yonginensis]WBO86402.1 hypothetical protein O9Z63_09095 [Hymenobacter yonginensis]
MNIEQTTIISLNELFTFLVTAQLSVDDDPTIYVTKTDDVYNLATEYATAQLDMYDAEDVLYNLCALPQCLEDEEFGYCLWDIMFAFEDEYPQIQPNLPIKIVETLIDWIKMRSEAPFVFKKNKKIHAVVLGKQSSSSFFIPITMSTWLNDNFLKFNKSYPYESAFGLMRSHKISSVLG